MSEVSIRDVLDAYLTHLETLQHNLTSLENQLNNNISRIDVDNRQLSTSYRHDIECVQNEIKVLRSDINCVQRDITKLITDIEKQTMETDHTHDLQIQELQLMMLKTGAGSGIIATFIMQLIIEVIKYKFLGGV